MRRRGGRASVYVILEDEAENMGVGVQIECDDLQNHETKVTNKWPVTSTHG